MHRIRRVFFVFQQSITKSLRNRNEILELFREICYDDFAKAVIDVTYLTIHEAAAKYELSSRRVQQMCKAGEIPGAVKDGRAWKVPKDAVPEGPRTSEKPRLPLPVGISSYIEAVSKYYYVDKTLLIRDFIDTLPKVSLITRPRRFGKTLNMDMLRVYFEKSERDTSVYFQNKAIWACGKHYRSFQGRYPVIYLSFKDVKYNAWADAYKDISECIAAEYARHAELADSSACSAMEKACYQRIVSGTHDEVDLSRSLSMLSAMLRKHHGEAAVIIIDEYDTPIQQGHLNGYYREVVAFIRNLFSGAFKDNPNLAYGFLTGILRVAKESIFSGMNNLKVHTIMDSRFSSYFGFTENEISEMLRYFGQPKKMTEIREWYNGYLFGNSEIYNPWSVINYVDEGCIPKAFWQSTGSNDIIGEIASAATPDITKNLRKLMQGESLTTYIDTDVIYPRVKENPFSIYSFLLLTGYLKNAEIVPQADGNYMCRVEIPNREISLVYSREVLAKVSPKPAQSTAAAIQQAVFERDFPMLQRSLETFLMQTVSYFDSSDEAFYQGLMIGLCAALNNCYRVRSNRESGYGRFDIQLFPMIENLPGFLIELKATKDKAADLEVLSSEALDQIEEKRYVQEMQESGVREIICIGMAFRGKEVAVRSK